jgi:AraC-like DNA-binding protein
MKLLAGSNYEARVIAEMCGFKRLNSFHVAFKQVTGLSPQQYRKSLAAAFPAPVSGAGWFRPLERNRMGSVPALGTRSVRQLVAHSFA